ncbi:MAG: cytochrome b/b6 domain-containing protein [Burkholderiales bacterium]|nr:cytochrome b/b6 domain-containing protein [Burkholderiales bacterium]
MTGATQESSILVWDAPVRVFHWLLVLSFAGAYLTAEGERWRLVHVTLGYTMAGLLAFRLLWGAVGTRYARFASFVRGPAAVLQYLRTMVRGAPAHFTGHNPAGAMAIVLMLASGVVIAVTGWTTYNEIGGEWLSGLHEGAANTMLAIVGVHIAGVISASWLHRENLVRSMVTGRKTGAHGEGVRWSWWPLALAIIALVAAFWWLQWTGAPAA